MHLVHPILSLPDSDLLQISWVPDLFNDRRPSCVVETTVPASRTDSSCGEPAATEMNLDATRSASSGQAQCVPPIYLSGGGAETVGLGSGLSAAGGGGGVLWRESVGGAARLCTGGLGEGAVIGVSRR